jgi:hypothetical protein
LLRCVTPFVTREGRLEQAGVRRPKMENSRGNGRTLMRTQLEFASMVVDAYAQSAKFWWGFWGGPCREPAIEAVEAVAETQQHYIEILKEALEKSESQT